MNYLPLISYCCRTSAEGPMHGWVLGRRDRRTPIPSWIFQIPSLLDRHQTSIIIRNTLVPSCTEKKEGII